MIKVIRDKLFKKKIIGYTTGVFDLFHIGHLNILKNCKSMCDHLIVGVTSDELVRYKNKSPVIPFIERLEIIRNIKFVDTAVQQNNMDKIKAFEKFKFDILFVGDDWQKTKKWNQIEKKLDGKGVKVIYFPYTIGTSSTLINKTLQKLRK